MKLLLVTQFYPPEVGAASIRMASWAAALRRAGVEVEVATALPNYPSGRIDDAYRRKLTVSEEVDSIAVHRTWLYAAHGGGGKRVLNYASFAALLPLALRRASRPDIVLVNSSPLTFAPVGLAAAKMWSSTAILSVSDLWPQSLVDIGMIGERVARPLRHFERAMYRRFDIVNAVTPSIQASLLVEHGVPSERVTLLGNGVDTLEFSPQRAYVPLRELPDPRLVPTFVFPGTLGLFNGLESVVRAAAIVEESNRSFKVVFVGGGTMKDRLKSLSETLALSSVQFHDHVPPAEFSAYLPHCRAGIVSLRAGLDIGALPAKTFAVMSSGIPVIFSGEGDGASIVVDADAGIVVPPEQPDELAKAMISLIDNPEEGAPMGRNGRVYAEENLSWDALAQGWLDQLASRGAVS